MKYKKSQFNSEIDEMDGGVLVFNTLTSAILWVPNDMWECQVYSGELTEEWKCVIDSGIWIDESRDECREMETYLKNSIENPTGDIVITIAPTYACNMRCSYCFQKDDNEIIMSEEMADKVFASVVPIMLRYESVHITWFGGEPLLALNIIAYLSSKFIDFCNTNQILYSADIITNGTLLNSKAVEILERSKISNIQITLDGIKHDDTRTMKDGTSSYSTIVNNIVQNADKFIIVVRSNVTEDNISDIKSMIDELMVDYHLMNKIFFSFYPVTSFEGKSSKRCDFEHFCGVSVYDTKLVELLKHVIKYQKLDTVTNILFSPSTIPCQAILKDTVCFDVRGDVYKCALSMQNVETKIGNILEKPIEDILNDGNQNGWLSFEWDEGCKECNFLPMCHSGCIYRKRAAGKGRLCSIDKTTHKQLVKLIYEYSEGIVE